VHFTFYLKAGTVEQQGNGTRGRYGQRMRKRMNFNSRTGRYILRIPALYPKSADLTAWIAVKTAAYRNVGHLTARKAVTKREDLLAALHNRVPRQEKPSFSSGQASQLGSWQRTKARKL
jgi:hypothetical protein